MTETTAKPKLSLSIAVLAYNESKNFPDIITRLAEVFPLEGSIDLKAVVVNNGSTDNTSQVIEDLERQYSWLSHVDIATNIGYGYGVKTGLAALEADVVGFIWGDNQFDAGILADMVEAFSDPEVEVVKTYRTKRHDGASRLFVSYFYQKIFHLLYRARVRDINSGPKLFRQDFLKKLIPFQSNDWFIDAEMMIKCSKLIKPNQLIELPIVFYPRKHGKSNVKFSVCWQFLGNLFKYRFKKEI